MLAKAFADPFLHIAFKPCAAVLTDLDWFWELTLISAVFKSHVKFQSETDADALALWIAMTYVMDQLEIAPMLYVTSPEPMCGKSAVIKLLKVFSHRAEMVSKITPAAI